MGWISVTARASLGSRGFDQDDACCGGKDTEIDGDGGIKSLYQALKPKS